jgi:hypothetical protein
MGEADHLRALGLDAAWLQCGDPDAELLVEVVQAAKMRVERFTEKQMLRGQCQVTARSLVVGGLPSVKSALRALGQQLPAPLDYPRPLTPFVRRRVWPSTLAAAHAAVEGSTQPIFVKPSEVRKRFTGVVLGSGGSWPLATIPGRTAVWCSEVVSFKNERWAFVCNGQVLEVRQYWGDPTITPRTTTIEAMVTAFGTGAPDAYALDVGVLASGGTALIEVNDGFALGSYGLATDRYLAILGTLWRQLLGPVTGPT